MASNEQIIHINGVDLCVETFGLSTDPAIVLLGGAGSCMLSWHEDFCAMLAAGGRFVVRYDNRDHGRSTHYEVGNPTYDISDVVDDVIGLLDALHIERAHVVGVSGGGAVAQLLAIEHADRLATVTLSSTTPGGPGHETPDLPPMSEALRVSFETEQPEQDWSNRDETVASLVDFERIFGAQSVPFDKDAAQQFWERVYDRSDSIGAQLTNPFMVGAGDPWRDRLADITTPTLVLHGTEDPMFPHEHGEALAKEIPGAQLLSMETVGHENPPRRVWGVVVPAILEHTAHTRS